MNYVALGGDGFSAPFSAIVVRAMSLTHDASAGNATISIVMDDRYCSLVSYAAFNIEQATIDDEQVIQMSIASAGGTANMIDLIAGRAAPTTMTSPNYGGLWTPPAWILPGSSLVTTLSFAADNVNTDVSFLGALIYQFDLNVRQTAPVGLLNFARGSI